MLPDRVHVSNPGPLTYESGALPIALHGPAEIISLEHISKSIKDKEMKLDILIDGNKKKCRKKVP